MFQFRLEILICLIGMGIGSSIGTARYEFDKDYHQYRSSALLLTTVFSVGFLFFANVFLKPFSRL